MSFVSLRFTIKRDLFRLGPIWALLVGVALANTGATGDAGEATSPLLGVFPAQYVALLILALFLVDMIWGGLWEHLLVFARSRGEVTSPALPALPYAQATAPFTRLWSWLREEDGRQGRDAGLGLAAVLLALAGIVALMILVAGDLPAGEAALAASVAVIILALLGAILYPAFPAATQLLAAAIGVGWPWLLGPNLLAWQTLAPFMWLLIAGFVCLAFVQEVGGETPSPTAALASYGVVLAALIWAAEPWAAVEEASLWTALNPALLPAWLAALIFSVPAWRLLRGRPAGVARWHLLARVVIALSLAAAPL